MRVRVPRQLVFWCAVGGVSLIAPVVFNLGVNKLAPTFPALDQFRDFVNGNGAK